MVYGYTKDKTIEIADKNEFFITFGTKQDHSLKYLRGMVKDTRTTTLLTVRTLSRAELDWQYGKSWNIIGALLAHIAAIEHYFRIVYVENRLLTDRENTELIPALDMGVHIPSLITGKSIDSYINDLVISRQKLLASFEEMTFENFSKAFNTKDDGAESNLAYLLYHMMEDEIYHRGQISVIKKLLTGVRNNQTATN